jgi:hypothetical protein
VSRRIEQAHTNSLENSFLLRPTAIERHSARFARQRLQMNPFRARKALFEHRLPKNTGLYVFRIDSNLIVRDRQKCQIPRMGHTEMQALCSPKQRLAARIGIEAQISRRLTGIVRQDLSE